VEEGRARSRLLAKTVRRAWATGLGDAAEATGGAWRGRLGEGQRRFVRWREQGWKELLWVSLVLRMGRQRRALCLRDVGVLGLYQRVEGSRDLESQAIGAVNSMLMCYPSE
jgi:hypothetical protein